MTSPRKTNFTVREAVGVFDSVELLEAAINELQASGFERYQISVLGSETSIKKNFVESDIPEKLSENTSRTAPSAIQKEALGVGQGVIIGNSTFAGMLLAAASTEVTLISGTLVATLAIGAVEGAALKTILAKLLGNEYLDFFQKRLEQGDLLLWVAVSNPEVQAKAFSILRKYKGRNVHAHNISVAP
jgi:hypothetical protein